MVRKRAGCPLLAKQTWPGAPHMSAFEGKADMTFYAAQSAFELKADIGLMTAVILPT